MPAPRPGSRKATIYNTFHDEGLDAALKQGAELRLAPGTIRSWCSAWSKQDRVVSSEPRVKLRKAGDAEERVLPKKNKDFGTKWDMSKYMTLYTLDNMRWADAPLNAKAGDKFDWGPSVWLVVEQGGKLHVKQLRSKIFDLAPAQEETREQLDQVKYLTRVRLEKHQAAQLVAGERISARREAKRKAKG